MAFRIKEDLSINDAIGHGFPYFSWNQAFNSEYVCEEEAK